MLLPVVFKSNPSLDAFGLLSYVDIESLVAFWYPLTVADLLIASIF